MRNLILIIFIFSGCKKEPSTSIQVLESVTNFPLGGADVFLSICSNSSCNGGTLLFKGVTDNNGICQVSSENYIDANTMYVDKEKYWFETQKNTTVYLTPEGWVQLRIRKVGNYPVDSELVLTTVSESGRPYITLYSTLWVVDSLISVTAFGGQINKIDWQVVPVSTNIPVANGTLTGLQIPRFDTLKNVTLNY